MARARAFPLRSVARLFNPLRSSADSTFLSLYQVTSSLRRLHRNAAEMSPKDLTAAILSHVKHAGWQAEVFHLRSLRPLEAASTHPQPRQRQ